jgi:hypothetical protein
VLDEEEEEARGVAVRESRRVTPVARSVVASPLVDS